MAFTKIAAAGIGSTETVTLHSLEVLNNATVGGVLTYEDVTNVDSIGIITARAGVLVGSGITLSKDGDGFFTGIVTATTFKGDGSGLTGVASTDNIRTNTNATFLQNINVSGSTTTGSAKVGVDTGVYGENLVVTGNARVTGITTFGDSNNPASMLNIDATSGIPAISIPDSIIHSADTNTKIRFPSADTITAETSGNERLRITSTGQVFIGDSVSSSFDAVLLRNTDGNAVAQIVNVNTGSSVQSILQLQVGTDRYVNFNCNYTGAYLQLQGVNITKSYHDFDEHNFRANNGTSKLVLNSTGKATFTSATANQRGVSIVAPKTQLNFGPNLDKGGFLLSENNGQFGLSGGAYWTGSDWVATHTGAGIIRMDGDGVMHFLANTGLTDGNTFTPTERLTISSDGILTCFGRTGREGRNGTTAGNVINFMWTVSATLQAWIDTTNIGNLSYSSDYRIKKNITTMSDGAIDRIKLLRPVTYQPDDFTLNGTVVSAASDTVKEGFIAHEVGEIISSGCEGEKDAENQIQSLQLDAIVSVSTKALQELIAKVETLEAKVAALEGS